MYISFRALFADWVPSELTRGRSYNYKKMDEFGKACAASVHKKVMDETVRLQKKHQAPAAAPSQNEGPPEPPVILTANKERWCSTTLSSSTVFTV